MVAAMVLAELEAVVVTVPTVLEELEKAAQALAMGPHVRSAAPEKVEVVVEAMVLELYAQVAEMKVVMESTVLELYARLAVARQREETSLLSLVIPSAMALTVALSEPTSVMELVLTKVLMW